MNEEKINSVLPLMFKKVKIPRQAKDDLRKRLFESRELLEDDLEFIAAAGNPPELDDIEKEKKRKRGYENGKE